MQKMNKTVKITRKIIKIGVVLLLIVNKTKTSKIYKTK